MKYFVEILKEAHAVHRLALAKRDLADLQEKYEQALRVTQRVIDENGKSNELFRAVKSIVFYDGNVGISPAKSMQALREMLK